MLKTESTHPGPSLAALLAAVICLLVFPGCSESKRLDAEISKTKLEIESLRNQLSTANDEFELDAKTLVLLKTQQAKLAKVSSYEELTRKLELEVNVLTEREKTLTQSNESLRQDMDKYKKFSN